MHRHRRPASIPRGSRAGPEVDRCAHESRRARGGLRLGPSGRAKEAKERWGGHRTCHAPYRPVERLLTVRAGLPAPANSGLAGACGAVGTPTPGPCPRLALNRGRTPVAGSPGRRRQMRRRRPRPTSTGPGDLGARGGAPETSWRTGYAAKPSPRTPRRTHQAGPEERRRPPPSTPSHRRLRRGPKTG